MKYLSILSLLTAVIACAAPEEPAGTTAEPAGTTAETAGTTAEPVAISQDELIRNAERAGPASIAADSTIMDWEFNVIRQGSNGWTCLPDRPDTSEDDPWCVNEPWLNFLRAYVSQTEPTYTGLGFAYMLVGDSPVSNSDPFATEPTGPEDWVTDLGGHLMMLVPDSSLFEGFSTDHRNGGPWIMWPDTPYAHIMIPIESR